MRTSYFGRHAGSTTRCVPVPLAWPKASQKLQGLSHIFDRSVWICASQAVERAMVAKAEAARLEATAEQAAALKARLAHLKEAEVEARRLEGACTQLQQRLASVPALRVRVARLRRKLRTKHQLQFAVKVLQSETANVSGRLSARCTRSGEPASPSSSTDTLTRRASAVDHLPLGCPSPAVLHELVCGLQCSSSPSMHACNS